MIAQTLGEKLRKLRIERDLSQRTLASMAGISANSVGLIERGEISSSVSTLQNLATALNVRMSYFFEEETSQNTLLIKANQRSKLENKGVRIESVSSRLHGQEMEPFIIHLDPHTSIGERQVIHSGHEVVFCTQGRIEYYIDGTSYFLDEGDFLIFEANLPHLWRNPHDFPAEFLLILQTPEAKLDPVKRHFADYPSISHIK